MHSVLLGALSPSCMRLDAAQRPSQLKKEASVRARLRGRTRGDRPRSKRRLSQKSGRFSQIHLFILEIQRFGGHTKLQKTADVRREPKILAENCGKLQSGVSVTLDSSP